MSGVLKKYYKGFILYIIICLLPFVLTSILWMYYTPSISILKRILASLFITFILYLPYTIGILNKICKEIWFYIISVPLFLFSLAQSGHLLLYHVPFSAFSIAALFATDFSEASGYIKNYFDIRLFLIITLYILIYWAVLLYSKRSIMTFCNKKLAYIVLLIFALFFSVGNFCIKKVTRVNWYYFFQPYELVEQFNDYKTSKECIENVSQSDISKYNIKSTNDDDFTLFVVIGESANRKHQQLYGYGRNTNPFIETQIDRMLIFDNIYSPAANTDGSLNRILLMPTEDGKGDLSLIRMLNELNIETYWFSAQNMYNASTSPLALSSKYILPYKDMLGGIDFYDTELLSKIDEQLKTTKSGQKVVFIQINGSHFPASRRYPENYSVFNNRDGIESPYINSEKAVKTINEYDNSILYTDHFLEELINNIVTKQDNSLLIYFSDHGQDIYDVDKTSGHSYTRNIGKEIPFWVWYSDEYYDNNQTKITEWSNTIHRPALTDSLGYFIADTLGIEIEDENKSRSPISACYKEYDLNLPESY